MSEPTPDERRRAAEWLGWRAIRLHHEADKADLFGTQSDHERFRHMAEALERAGDAYEKGEQP